MQIHISTYTGIIGSFQARIIDESMGVIGGELQPTDLYFDKYQALFRAHMLEPNWRQIEQVGLKAITETGHELRAEAGMVISDMEEFPDELTIEVCGLYPEDVALAIAN